MEDKKWIKTEQMLEYLRQVPNVELIYYHRLGTWLYSIHYLQYDSNKNLYGDSTEVVDLDWYTEAQFLEIYSGEWWMKAF